MRLVSIPPLALPEFWYVCFMKAEREAWWDRFLPPGFRHVYLIGYVPAHDVWLLFDPRRAWTVLGVVAASEVPSLLSRALREGAALIVKPDGLAVSPGWRGRIGFYCVPAVRAALGLRCVAVTPKGLHDYLLATGAKPLEIDDVRGAE